MYWLGLITKCVMYAKMCVIITYIIVAYIIRCVTVICWEFTLKVSLLINIYLIYCKFQTHVLDGCIMVVILYQDFQQITALPTGTTGMLVCATGAVTCQSAVTFILHCWIKTLRKDWGDFLLRGKQFFKHFIKLTAIQMCHIPRLLRKILAVCTN